MVSACELRGLKLFVSLSPDIPLDVETRLLFRIWFL